MSDFNREWKNRFGWPVLDQANLPLAIAHRGASGHRTENTMEAFRLATELSSEMWELDVRLSADGVLIVSHDDNLARVTGRGVRVSESTWDQLETIAFPGGNSIPRFDDVVDLAVELGAGLYVEAKSEGSAQAAWRILDEKRHSYAAIGSFNVEWISDLRRAGCPIPLSVLIPSGANPFEYSKAARPDILHLCWRDAADQPHLLITDELVEYCHAIDAALVIWHEDRRQVLNGLAKHPILGICSDRPEVLKPYCFERGKTPAIVCHRGANYIAPENTREAARVCMDQMFQFVEIDVRTTADLKLVVLHDATLDRTTNGNGQVSERNLEDIKTLDAGSWKAPVYSGFKVPTLGEVLDICHGKIGVYIEIKDADPDAVLIEVLVRDMLEDVFFWCSDREVMQCIREQRPDARLMATRGRYSTLNQAIDDYNADIIEFEFGCDDLTEVAQCRELGVASMVFSLSHDVADLASVLAANPDLVNLDRPDLFKILASYPTLFEISENVAVAGVA